MSNKIIVNHARVFGSVFLGVVSILVGIRYHEAKNLSNVRCFNITHVVCIHSLGKAELLYDSCPLSVFNNFITLVPTSRAMAPSSKSNKLFRKDKRSL